MPLQRSFEMGMFDAINEAPFSDTSRAGTPTQGAQGSSDGRFRLLATLISAPDILSKEAKAFRELDNLVRKKFLELTANLGVPGESEYYARLLGYLENLSVLVQFPYLANKNVVAVGGEFSAGKSRFLNSVFGVGNLLPSGVNPTTSIPTYLTQGSKESIIALNTFNRVQKLTREELGQISHGFNDVAEAENRMSFYHILKKLEVRTPEIRWENIAFLDTPGYSKPKEGLGDSDLDEGTDAGNTDEKKAAEHLRDADYLIWIVGAKDGTLQQPGIDFLKKQVKWTKPVYLVVNKADEPARHELEGIYERISSDMADKFTLAGACAYSSRENSVFLGDDPRTWFDDINRRRKLTEWRGEFKDSMSGVIDFCAKNEKQFNRYVRLLRQVECGEGGVAESLLDELAQLRKELEERQPKLRVAVAAFSSFVSTVEKKLGGLLDMLGVVEKSVSDVGLRAVSEGAGELHGIKRGGRLEGKVDVFSRFRGCFISIPAISRQARIRYADIEASCTDPGGIFAVGRQVDLIVHDVDYKSGRIEFAVCKNSEKQTKKKGCRHGVS